MVEAASRTLGASRVQCQHTVLVAAPVGLTIDARRLRSRHLSVMASFGGGAAAAEREITSPGILFYLIAPVKHSTLEDVPPYVTQAVPWFFAMIFGELLVSALQGRKTLARRHNLKEALCSISLGILSQVWGIPIAAAGLRAYCYLYANYALWKLPPDDSYLCWGLGLLGVDFAYYVFHRFSHEFHLFWMGHSVHHSGEFYNVATALRQSALSTPGSSIVYSLAVLDLPPPAFLAQGAQSPLSVLDTPETIGDLGPLEYISTPITSQSPSSAGRRPTTQASSSSGSVLERFVRRARSRLIVQPRAHWAPSTRFMRTSVTRTASFPQSVGRSSSAGGSCASGVSRYVS